MKSSKKERVTTRFWHCDDDSLILVETHYKDPYDYAPIELHHSHETQVRKLNEKNYKSIDSWGSFMSKSVATLMKKQEVTNAER